METKPDIHPVIEKLINGSKEQRMVFDKINQGKPFTVGGRKYRIVSGKS